MSKSIPESEVPEVEHFMAIATKIERWKAAYPDVFEHFAELQEDYNQALEAAEKKVRALGVSCGPFDNFQSRTTYDPEKLYEELGEAEFLRVGGKTKTTKSYELDKAKFEARVTDGSIPKEVVEVVKKVSLSYKTPKKINI